jgi:SAM-dependent methyltransferase
MVVSRFGHDPYRYERFRPRYPARVGAQLRSHLLERRDCINNTVDCGAGTGISTRWLRRFVSLEGKIMGVEPDPVMRRMAELSTPHKFRIEYLAGCAEGMPVESQSADLLLLALVMQWTDRTAVYEEAKRVLRPGGVIAVLSNDRLWKESTFLDRYEDALEDLSPGYERTYRAFDYQSEMEVTEGLACVTGWEARWVRHLTRNRFREFALSSSKVQAAIATHGLDGVTERIDDCTAEFADSERLIIPYVTSLVTAIAVPVASRCM